MLMQRGLQLRVTRTQDGKVTDGQRGLKLCSMQESGSSNDDRWGGRHYLLQYSIRRVCQGWSQLVEHLLLRVTGTC